MRNKNRKKYGTKSWLTYDTVRAGVLCVQKSTIRRVRELCVFNIHRVRVLHVQFLINGE